MDKAKTNKNQTDSIRMEKGSENYFYEKFTFFLFKFKFFKIFYLNFNKSNKFILIPEEKVNKMWQKKE